MKLKTISSLNLKGKKVLLRIDINAALHKNKPLDNPRFEAHGKTIKSLSEKKSKIVILAHQGRKNGKDFIANLRLHTKLLKKYSLVKIKYIDDLFGREAKREIENLREGEVILLRNVRDYPEENRLEKNNKYIEFSKNFDLYVNDAFSICHRKQGSIMIPPKTIKGYAGPVLESEFKALSKFKSLKNKKLLLVLGGEKIKDYLPILDFLNKKSVKLMSGGVFGNLVLHDKGINLGYEEDWLKKKGYLSDKKLKRVIKNHKNKIISPIDLAVKNKGREEISIQELPVEKKIMDIGEKSVELFKEEIDNSKAVLMKGPMGFSEIKGFEYGTKEILKHISKKTQEGKTYSLIGGGNLTTVIKQYKIKNKFSHVSLSGGALVKFLSGEKLPGLNILTESKKHHNFK